MEGPPTPTNVEEQRCTNGGRDSTPASMEATWCTPGTKCTPGAAGPRNPWPLLWTITFRVQQVMVPTTMVVFVQKSPDRAGNDQFHFRHMKCQMDMKGGRKLEALSTSASSFLLLLFPD